MKRIMILVLLASVLVAIPTGTAVAKAEKTDVCHLNSLGAWQTNNVTVKAADAHLRHGDALPGDPVPAMTGYEFGEDCSLVLVDSGGIGAPCTSCGECESDWCLDDGSGEDGICTDFCVGTCPEGWSCVDFENEAGDPIALCVPDDWPIAPIKLDVAGS